MSPPLTVSPLANCFASNHEQTLLVKLNEECGEVIQASCKAQLHGFAPYWEGVQYNNLEDIERELGDVMAIRDFLLGTGTLNQRSIDHYRQLKLHKLPQMLGWPKADDEPCLRGVFE
jgi:hypothetical protein